MLSPNIISDQVLVYKLHRAMVIISNAPMKLLKVVSHAREQAPVLHTGFQMQAY